MGTTSVSPGLVYFESSVQTSLLNSTEHYSDSQLGDHFQPDRTKIKLKAWGVKNAEGEKRALNVKTARSAQAEYSGQILRAIGCVSSLTVMGFW
jgi:hypothetical protein